MKRSIPGLPHLSFNNIFCIGRNYALHAQELNNPVPQEPVVFLKPNSAVPPPGTPVSLPDKSSDVHHEVELVIAIGMSGKEIPVADAGRHIGGYGIGIDFTARDLQQTAKDKGLPWAVAKGFDTFAPLSTFLPAGPDEDFTGLGLELRVNGVTRQKGHTGDMIFPVHYLVSWLSGIFTLQPGDLVFTGTPAGVGPVHSGDELIAVLGDNLQTLKIHVA